MDFFTLLLMTEVMAGNYGELTARLPVLRLLKILSRGPPAVST